MLIVLVGLKRNAGQCAVTLDTLRLPQKTVPGIEAALKQLLDIDLTAGSRQGKEIKIVDVNIPILVSLTVFRLEHVHLIKLLGCLTAVLEHGAHGRIAVDIRILPLQIAFAGRLEGKIPHGQHQAGFALAHAGAFVAIKNVGLCRAGMTKFNQGLFHQILNFLHVGHAV